MANGLIVLDSAKIEGSIGVLQRQINVEVLDKVTPVAQAVKNSGDNNKVVQEYLEVSIKFQKHYNEFLDSIKEFIKDAEQVYDISEYMAKKATVGDITNRDLSFETSKIDASKVMGQ